MWHRCYHALRVLQPCYLERKKETKIDAWVASKILLVHGTFAVPETTLDRSRVQPLEVMMMTMS
jgi:hypothetical protein